jgi:hypothetical protein
MQKFNKSIEISIPIDAIANQLLEQFNPEFKHKELVVETIIGRMLTTDERGISKVFNSLNGYTGDINFKIGDLVVPIDLNMYGYWDQDSIDNKKATYKAIKSATVLNINKFADESLEIAYESPQSDGSMKTQTCWISHLKCDLIPQ